MVEKRKYILIFTDLDGTLLDSDDYSFEEALPALEEIKRKKIPLILCSSKTKAEIELYQRKLEVYDPFISENGGAIFIPPGYFQQTPPGLEKKGRYLVLELGIPYQLIRRKFLEVSEKLNLKIVGFGDLKAEEISSLLNLSKTEAELAKKREYDEPFYFLEEIEKEKIKLAEQEFNKDELSLTTGGKLFHLTGGNDKGKAIGLLIQIYKSNRGDDLLTIGLGDSLNDLPLLESVDIPVVVRKKGDLYEQSLIDKLSSPPRGNIYKAKGIGSQGWNQAILDLIEKYEVKEK